MGEPPRFLVKKVRGVRGVRAGHAYIPSTGEVVRGDPADPAMEGK